MKALAGMVWPPMKIYVAGPYTAPNPRLVQENVDHAIDTGIEIIRRGHFPYIPHLMHYVEMRNDDLALMHGIRLDYETYMRLDREWILQCDALYMLGSSPGSSRDLEIAKENHLAIYTTIDRVPFAGSLVGEPKPPEFPDCTSDCGRKANPGSDLCGVCEEVLREEGRA